MICAHSISPGPCLACVKKTRNCHAVRKMKVDPPEPPCRRRLQTAISCCGPMTMVVNVMVKRRDSLITSSKDGRDECKRTSEEASKTGFNDSQNWDLHLVPGRAWKVPTYWPCGVRCIGGMTLIQAFVRNLRTGSVMIRERLKWRNHEAENTDAPARGGLLRKSDETG